MKAVKTIMRKQSGIALITTLLLLLLMSAMVVGFVLLVTEGQRLSGMNNDQSRAFYGAEAGMEKLTADLGALFSVTYAPSGPQVNAIATVPPILPSSAPIKFVDSQGTSTYKIEYIPDNNGNPKASFGQITSGSSQFQGMTALETPYTLTVGARTANGAEVKLQRTLQTVGIPLFQFGIYCEGDCSFFAGPNFDFGGRVHTNGNLFLNSGGPAGAGPTNTGTNQLWLRSPVTVAKDIFRDCLSNTHPESPTGNHPGSVEITKGGGALQALAFGQGSLTSCLASAPNGSWKSISDSYNGNLRAHVPRLDLAITLLGNGASQPVDLIRRPVQGEDATNPGVLGERYFAEASLKILLSDNAADITNLPCVSGGAPFNLADIARPVASWVTPKATALQAAMTAAGTTPLPLAASGAAQNAAAYVPGTAGGDGYWQPGVITGAGAKPATPVITGYIKIDAQTAYGNPCGAWIDVTQEILSLGYAGRNINPVPQSFDGNNLNPNWGGTAAKMEGLSTAPPLPILPPIDPNTGGAVQMASQNGAALGSATFTAALFNKGTCLDPHPNAVIRLERIRDNPSSVNVATGKWKAPPTNLPVRSTTAEVCGVDPATGKLLANLRLAPGLPPGTGAAWTPQPSDFWPNVFFDTREGYNREVAPTGAFLNRITLGGAMNYVELDVRNLARWFSGTIGAAGPGTRDPNVAPNNFVVYVSDRRSNYVPVAPFAVTWPPLSPTGNESGEYGYTDFVNPADIKGCPNNTLDTGEDLDSQGVLYTYGANTFPNGLIDSTGTSTAATIFPNVRLNATAADPLCAGPNGGFPWPRTFLVYPNEARENPPALFRRAVKLVNGSLISLPLCPGAVTCGLTIATANPVYVQGDYNANSAGGGWADPNVAASVIADAFTFLSSDWSDINSFSAPFCAGPSPTCPISRAENVAGNWYRLGVVAGKEISFPIPNWDTPAIDGSQDFGTDGGVHNFMRYLEKWNGKLNYQGSIVGLYYNRQATGLFNSGNNNYSPPSRGYIFDSNFLNPLLLPPRTPMFRTINTTGFTQLLLPGQ